MASCTEHYISINGIKKCGMTNINEETGMPDLPNVELSDAGQSVTLHLKNTADINDDGFFVFVMYTGDSIPTDFGEKFSKKVKAIERKYKH